MKKNRLGRGLDALLEPARRDDRAVREAAGAPPAEAPVEALRPGRYQPRRRHSEETLAELAASIREQGVLQPLVVRPLPSPGSVPETAEGFEIVAGERRWRAARIAGLPTVPVVVRELDDQSALAVALIENLQREDLNPVDQAHSLSKLALEFGLTHEQVARAVGRSRASVSNLLRLLDLEEDVKEMLAAGHIDMGHARALLPLDAKRQVAMARKVSTKQLSVRQVEKAVRNLLAPAGPGGEAANADLQTRWLQQQIAGELGRKISIRPDTKGGYGLRVDFCDLSELNDTLERLRQLIAQVLDTAGPRVRDASR